MSHAAARWNSTLGLIVLVAGIAVVTAVSAAMSTAIYGGRDNPLLGLGLVVASVGALSWNRMAGEVARRQEGGESLSRWAGARLLLASLGFALLTIGLSGVAFVVVFGMLTEMTWDFPRVKFDGGTNLPMVVTVLIAGTLVVLVVGFLVRRAYGAGVSQRRRMARLLVPLGIVVLMVWGEAMRCAVIYRLVELAKHDRWYRMDEGDMVDLGMVRAYAQKLREHHAVLREKWEYLVWHPWMPADPDPPEPKGRYRPVTR